MKKFFVWVFVEGEGWLHLTIVTLFAAVAVVSAFIALLMLFIGIQFVTELFF